jgi:hypothetical protein
MMITSSFITASVYWVTSGPILNLSPSSLTGWTQCYNDTYDVYLNPILSTILTQCNGAKLLLACRPVASSIFTVAAMGLRSDVVYDTGTSATTTHVANNVGWHYNAAWSWGFVTATDSVNLNQCDSSNTPNPGYHICWHTVASAGGFGCGTTLGLNSDNTWAREIWQAN